MPEEKHHEELGEDEIERVKQDLKEGDFIATMYDDIWYIGSAGCDLGQKCTLPHLFRGWRTGGEGR